MLVYQRVFVLLKKKRSSVRCNTDSPAVRLSMPKPFVVRLLVLDFDVLLSNQYAALQIVLDCPYCAQYKCVIFRLEEHHHK